MSLIDTSGLNGANPLDYLAELQRRAAELAPSPAEWVSWGHPDTPRRAEAERDAQELSMSITKPRSGKPAACAKCAGNDLQKRVTTYPVRLTRPASLAGKEIHVERVALYECQSCGHLMPTPGGQAQVDRWVAQAICSCDRPGCYEVFILTSPRQRFCSKECRLGMQRVSARERRWQEPRTGSRRRNGQTR